MTQIIGHRLVDAQDNVIETFGPTAPAWLRLPNGNHVHAPEVNVSYSGFTLEAIETPIPTLEEVRAAKIAALAAKRWEKETGGMIFNAMPLATDAVSQTKYIGAVVGAQMDPLSTMKWKLSNGTFVTLDATAIVAVAMAVRAHVQACFDNEADIKLLIEAADTVAEIDAIDLDDGWPA